MSSSSSVRSADWSSGVVLVNGHGGNAEAVQRAVDAALEGRRVPRGGRGPTAATPMPAHRDVADARQSRRTWCAPRRPAPGAPSRSAHSPSRCAEG